MEASHSLPLRSCQDIVHCSPMPDDEDSLPALAPQWLRSGSAQKASLGAGVGNQAHTKGMIDMAALVVLTQPQFRASPRACLP